MAGWVETTDRLIASGLWKRDFEQSDEYYEAFERWASRELPEEYGND